MVLRGNSFSVKLLRRDTWGSFGAKIALQTRVPRRTSSSFCVLSHLFVSQPLFNTAPFPFLSTFFPSLPSLRRCIVEKNNQCKVPAESQRLLYEGRAIRSLSELRNVPVGTLSTRSSITLVAIEPAVFKVYVIALFFQPIFGNASLIPTLDDL